MAGGRPTKFNATVLKVAKEYVDNHIEKGIFPTIEELAVEYLLIDDETVKEWTKVHENDTEQLAKTRREFSATIKRLMTYQKRHLTVQGLGGKVNTTMAIFLLKVNHGYVETARQELTGAEGQPLPTPTLTYMPKQLPDDYFSQPASNSSQ